jgi:uncharacterized protein YoxC
MSLIIIDWNTWKAMQDAITGIANTQKTMQDAISRIETTVALIDRNLNVVNSKEDKIMSQTSDLKDAVTELTANVTSLTDKVTANDVAIQAEIAALVAAIAGGNPAGPTRDRRLANAGERRLESRLLRGFAGREQREAVRVRQPIPTDAVFKAGRLPRARWHLACDVRSLRGVVKPIEGSDGGVARAKRLAKRPDAPSGGCYGTHAGHDDAPGTVHMTILAHGQPHLVQAEPCLMAVRATRSPY